MVIRLYRRHNLLVCICILAAVIGGVMAINKLTQPKSKGGVTSLEVSSAQVPERETEGAVIPTARGGEEMRAVWVPFMSLDISKEKDRSEDVFRAKFGTILKTSKECGMNTLIVHVRPFADALYPSQYYPWSHIVGGTQGVDPGYDPLAIMVEETHKAGMQFHAWINPLRIQASGSPSLLAPGNPYSLWKADAQRADWAVESGGGVYMNPAYPGVRQLVADGAREIAAKYDVDGIQFDDYFYPTQEAAFDQKAYAAYTEQASKNGVPLGLTEWRQANINALISLTYQEIKAEKEAVQFGIAPQGNIENNLKIGADVATWCSAKGYLDYICPQLYVNFENPVLPFGAAVETWKGMVKDADIDFYIGLAVYKAGSDADGGTWKKADDILAQQVSLGRKTSCDGFMFYSWEYLGAEQAKEEVQNVVKLLE